MIVRKRKFRVKNKEDFIGLSEQIFLFKLSILQRNKLILF